MLGWVAPLAIATGSTAAGVSGAMETAMGSVAGDAMSSITGMIPVAAPILGAIIVVGIAIKAFKKVSGNKG